MQNNTNRWSRKSIPSTDTNTYKERYNPSVSEMKSPEPFKDIPIVGYSVSAKGAHYFYVLDFVDGGSGHMSYSRLIDGKFEKPQKMSNAINTGKYIATPSLLQMNPTLCGMLRKRVKVLLISISVFDKKMVHGEKQLTWELK